MVVGIMTPVMTEVAMSTFATRLQLALLVEDDFYLKPIEGQAHYSRNPTVGYNVIDGAGAVVATIAGLGHIVGKRKTIRTWNPATSKFDVTEPPARRTNDSAIKLEYEFYDLDEHERAAVFATVADQLGRVGSFAVVGTDADRNEPYEGQHHGQFWTVRNGRLIIRSVNQEMLGRIVGRSYRAHVSSPKPGSPPQWYDRGGALQQAVGYHAKHMDGRRWPDLEQAFRNRANTFTGSGGDYTKPRLASLMTYLDHLTEPWPDGEQLIKAALEVFIKNPHRTKRHKLFISDTVLNFVQRRLLYTNLGYRFGLALYQKYRDDYQPLVASLQQAIDTEDQLFSKIRQRRLSYYYPPQFVEFVNAWIDAYGEPPAAEPSADD